ncbi:MAG: type I-C CRISPR-associated protein Cas8c/Csd1 [Roseburia sp.]|nr:type I-C CRISPR-associated protein Cas8c/Csd1 [Roseburia sp.]
MGIMQKALEAYECHSEYAGQAREEHETLAPVAHMIAGVQIEITVSGNGKFIDAKSVDKRKIIIPVTEESAGRTSKPCPHPLCEQLCYLAPYEEKRHEMYLEQLKQWMESEYTHPKLEPIYLYVKSGTILQDLAEDGVIKLTDKGIPEKEKQMVCWRVMGEEAGEGESSACWLDKKLIQNYISYYREACNKAEKGLCMVTGELSVLAKQHPKGIVSKYGNAKLVSANDQKGFTYRGRITEDWQAATVGYEVSQKAHNALQWIASEQRVMFGGRTFICWNPQGKKLKNPADVFLQQDEQDEPITEPSDYKQQLYNTLVSFQTKHQLTGTETAVIAALDAATTGRLAMTYYNELKVSDFLKRLCDWDATCYWINGKFGIQSPPLCKIINCAYGTQREEKGSTRMVADERVMCQQMQKLLDCRLRGGRIPVDIVQALARKASNPQAYERNCWYQILYIACAVIRKNRSDRYKEEWTVALDENNKNRSYLFGRLLAIAEKVEEDANRRSGAASEDKNESKGTKSTNASRMQAVFSKRPMYAWRILHEKLEPYYRRLKPGSIQYYKRLIAGIANHLDEKTSELNHPLEDIYLLGYYHQRQALYGAKELADSDETEGKDDTN